MLVCPGWWLAAGSGESETAEAFSHCGGREGWLGREDGRKGWGQGIGWKEPPPPILPPCLSTLEPERGYMKGTVNMGVFLEWLT